MAKPKDRKEITHEASDGILIETSDSTESFTFDKDLANTLGINEENRHHFNFSGVFIPNPRFYHMYCDLVDSQNNLFNGKPSELLETISIAGKSYEKVTYHQPNPFQTLRAKPLQYVSSLTLSVRDENGKLFDFNEMPLLFKLEIN